MDGTQIITSALIPSPLLIFSIALFQIQLICQHKHLEITFLAICRSGISKCSIFYFLVGREELVEKVVVEQF